MTNEKMVNAFAYDLGKMNKKEQKTFLSSLEVLILISKMGLNHLEIRYPFYKLGKEAKEALAKKPKPKKPIISKKTRNEQ
jgi:hypothetical protein